MSGKAEDLGSKFSKEELPSKILEFLYTSRLSDEKAVLLSKQNKGAAMFLTATGHEMAGIACALALEPGKDWVFPYYRDQPFIFAFGVPLKDHFASFLARDCEHHSSGRMMPWHFSDPSLKMPCQSSAVGAQFLQAVGRAKAIKTLGKDEVVYVSAGNGATSQGDFHEALNFSAMYKLPVIFVVLDNNWAISVPGFEQTVGGSIVPIVSGYPDVEVHDIDGTSFDKTYGAMKSSVERARKGDGPSVIVAKVPRLGPHTGSDDPTKYKTKEEIEEEKTRDPIMLYEKYLLSENIMSQDEMDSLKKKVQKSIDTAVKEAEEIPFPKPETVTKHLFVEGGDLEASPEENPSGQEVLMLEALNNAYHEEMERDSGVVTFGEDVGGSKGGVFGVTRGLVEKFGKERCFNTPLAESTIIGVAIGMSLDGFKPVAEIQYSDYMWTGINQIFNELSSVHYRSNGEWNCPVVVRMTCGGYVQGGPYHSQSVEGFLAHCPGLKIVIPSNSADAKGLLKMAIRDPNPVIFLEHKVLYRQRKFAARSEPSKDYLVPFGEASIVQAGADITLVAWGYMVPMSLEVVEKLSEEGISVELIDLRTIVPLDMETVLTSVKKTGKLLIVQESLKNCGFAAELATRAVEDAFEHLDAPVKRLCALDVPIPYSKVLEDEVLPQKSDIEKSIRDLYNY